MVCHAVCGVCVTRMRHLLSYQVDAARQAVGAKVICLIQESGMYHILAAPASTGSSSSSSSGSSSSSSSTPATTPAATASSDNTSVSVTNSGGWNDGSNNYYQYTITVKNTSSSPVKDWKLTVSFSSNVSIDQSWSGSFSASGSSVTVSPADFNKEIAAGQSVEVGMIVYSSGTLSTPTVSIN